MYYKLVFIFVLGLLLSSCSNNSNKGPIKLNNGDKWEINAEMMPPLDVSNKLIAEFMANDLSDYITLAEKLKENNNLLISSCTMKGKSHEELHKWLHPYMGLIDELANANDANTGKRIFQQIEKSFEEFNQYFQ